MAKIIVGMSGGVDSAVAAYLLKLAGHEVIGVTLRTWLSADGKDSRCCEIDDAQRAADTIGMPYFAQNCVADFRREVEEPFVREYVRGRTPNPCVVCNRLVKWEKLLEAAKMMQADFVATGHYAQIEKLPNGRFTVKKALHAKKDQTYMLYRLSQEQLARTLMPLGKLSKEEVRRIAKEAGLPVAAKPDSQEICFVVDGDYAEYVSANAVSVLPGEGFFVDTNGSILGKHKGIIHYTVGQRKGLGIALGRPAYVARIDAARNEVVLGTEEDLFHKTVVLRDINFMGIFPVEIGESFAGSTKVRYHHPAQPAVITRTGDDELTAEFEEPVKSPAPGQSAVIYDGSGCVLAGGIIV